MLVGGEEKGRGGIFQGENKNVRNAGGENSFSILRRGGHNPQE
jgi:hypothetical protein